MLQRLPVAKRLLIIVGVFVAIVVCVFALGILRAEILSGVRAYVGGEGLWSKAERRAVLSLTEYGESRNEADFQQYLREIAVPIGDKQARLQLQLPHPDMKLVREGLVQGRNSADDVENLAFVFRHFRRFGYMAQAIEIWTEGDGYIDQIRVLADELHREVQSRHADQSELEILPHPGPVRPRHRAAKDCLA